MASLIEDLLDPESLPDVTEGVSLVQTHISLVFIGDEIVYKLKKPVDFGFLDFSTLEKRRFFCEQEVTLNQRLSQDIYLGVLPVVFDGRRHRVGRGPGEVVEFAVHMRRIPEERLMKTLFRNGSLEEGHLFKIARVLAEFHQSALRNEAIDRFGEPEAFKVNTDENFEQVKKYIGATIDPKQYHALKEWTAEFYSQHRELFLKRIRDGRIRDCHGDLHMEHVCLAEDVIIFDCIEFNERFRYGDTVGDIAFLLMDLEFHGAMDKAKTLWNAYKTLARETRVDDLLLFYKTYRAFVRGKVNSFQLDDPVIDPDRKNEAVQTAKQYFTLAHAYIC